MWRNRQRTGMNVATAASLKTATTRSKRKAAMAKPKTDLLQSLRKRGRDGDVDFLREVLHLLVDGIMDAEFRADFSS